MSLALITVGTSFREALCWDIDEMDYSVFDESGVTPTDPDVRELRYKMRRETKDKDLDFFKNILIDRAEIGDYTWRYPAEIDTLIQFERFRNEEFESLNKIKFIISGNEDGRFAAEVLKEICYKLWPDKNFSSFESLEYSPIDEINELNTGLIRKIEEDLNSAEEQVFLFVTGGYKFVVILAGIAFQNSETEQKKHLIYKHEENAIIVHSEDIYNGESDYYGY